MRNLHNHLSRPENYIRITQASRPTATRDLYELFIKKVFIRTGEKKSTRYYLNV